MKFSLRELIFACLGVGGTLGMITNNYWMEHEVKRARQETELRVREEVTRKLERNCDGWHNKYLSMLEDMKKVNPKAADIYGFEDSCDCEK